jgi:hypothetical protein
MPKPVASILPIVTSKIIAVAALTTLQAVVVLAADDCVTEPNLRATHGGHWYYHVDRVTNRKCWFLRQQDVEGPSAVSQQAQLSPDATRQSTSPSWISSLTLGFAPAFGPEPQQVPPQSETRVIQPSAPDALRLVLPKQQPQIAPHSDSDLKLPAKMRQQSSPRSSEKRLARRDKSPDQVSRDALFRRNTLGTTLDKTDRDVLFREFLLWQEHQRSAEP